MYASSIVLTKYFVKQKCCQSSIFKIREEEERYIPFMRSLSSFMISSFEMTAPGGPGGPGGPSGPGGPGGPCWKR